MRHFAASLLAGALALSLPLGAQAQTVQVWQLPIAQPPLPATTAFWCATPINPALTAWHTYQCQMSEISATLAAGLFASAPGATAPYSASDTLLGADALNSGATSTFPLSQLSSYFGSHVTGLTVAQGGTGVATLTSHGLLVGEGTGAVQALSACTAGQVVVGQTSANPACETVSGDGTLTNLGVFTVGSLGGKAVSLGGALTLSGGFSTTLTVTGATALTLPTSGTLATVGGALGTPSSITLTNGTGLPVSTGLTGTGTGVKTALGVNTNASGGVALVNGAPTVADCLQWSASGIQDAGFVCGGAFASNAQFLAALSTTVATTPGNWGTQQSIGASGYVTIPGGLILQWGVTGTVGGSATATVTLPITCPNNAPFSVTATMEGAGTNGASVASKTTTQIQLTNNNAGNKVLDWMAICN